jgi:hypothetical protein
MLVPVLAGSLAKEPSLAGGGQTFSFFQKCHWLPVVFPDVLNRESILLSRQSFRKGYFPHT